MWAGGGGARVGVEALLAHHLFLARTGFVPSSSNRSESSSKKGQGASNSVNDNRGVSRDEEGGMCGL